MTKPAGVPDIDDGSYLSKIDAADMLSVVGRFPDMLSEIVKQLDSDGQTVEGDFNNVVISGMGGSAIGGDIVARLAAGSHVPVSVVRNYDLPAYAGKKTLFIAVSYSGNTEETLSAFRQAVSRGCTVAAVTTGGELLAGAEKNAAALYLIPGGLAPRAALPYLLMPLIRILELSGIAEGLSPQADEAHAVLISLRGRIGASVKKDKNPAKLLALRICGSVPLVFGSEPGTAAAAYRWKCQFNENSKMTSLSNSLPELDHNEIVNLGELNVGGTFSLIMLRDRHDNPRIGKRFEITKEIIGDAFKGGLSEIWSEGEGALARLLSLCYFGDYVSVYAALARGIDPSRITAINRLKGELSKA